MRFVLPLTAVLLCGAGSAPKQDAPRRTATVRLYADRDRLVDRADTLAEKGLWRDVIEIYAEAIKQNRNALIHVGRERYISVFDFAMRRLADAPEAARVEYRRRFDAKVRDEVASAARARDTDALRRIIESYPYSSFLDEALATRARLALDRGDAPTAAETLERLYAIQDSDIPRERTAAQLAQAYQLSGDAERLKRFRDQVRRDADLAARTLVVGNRRVTLSDYLGRLKARPRPIDEIGPRLADEWTQLGGDPSGFRLISNRFKLPAKRWEISMPDVSFFSGTQIRGGARRFTRPFATLFPAVADGTLFVHNEYEVRAYSLYTRKPSLLWSMSIPERAAALMQNTNAFQTITVQGGRVFVPLVTDVGESVMRRGGIPVTYAFPRRTLFALDAGTGEILWRLGGESGASEIVRNASIPLAPTSDGRYLYVGLVHQPHPTDVFSHYVACLDPADGRVVWMTFVASGHTEINLFGNSARESTGNPVTVSGDTAFYCTNHGAVAALDRATGRIRWLERYPQWEIRPTRNLFPRLNNTEWHNRPALVHKGRVYFAPTDALYLFCRELKSGAPVARLQRPFDARTIMGVVEDRIILGGQSLYAYDLNLHNAVWTLQSRSGFGGAGALSGTRAYRPTLSGIDVIDLKNGRRIDTKRYSVGNASDLSVNLVATPDVLVLAGSRGVAVCFTPGVLRRRVDEITRAADPTPEALYEAALKSMVHSDRRRTIDLLQRVRARTRAATHPTRARIHAATARHLFLMLAEAALEHIEAERHADAVTLLEQAHGLAPTAGQTVEVMLVLAEIHRRNAHPDRSLALLQELIHDHGDRRLDEEIVRRAVQRKIGQLIAEHGSALYAPFELEARRRLARSVEAGDIRGILQVARLYPNSRSAEAAFREALRITMERGEVQKAFAMMRTLIQTQPPGNALAGHAAQLVTDLEKRALAHVARTVLLMMRARLSGARVAGTPVPEFVRDHLALDLYALPAEPKPGPIGLPLERVGVYIDPDYSGGVPLPTDGPHLFVDFGKAVRALSWADLSRIWSTPVRGPVRHASVAGGVAVFATRRRLTGVALSDGKEVWSFDQPGRSEAHAFRSSRGIIYFSRPDATDPSFSEVVALDARTGIELWRSGYEGRVAAQLDVCDGALVFVALEPARLFVVDAFTGRRRLTRRLPNARMPYSVVAADARGVEIMGRHPMDGILRWNVKFGSEQWHADTGFPPYPATWSAGPGFHFGIARFTARRGTKHWLMRAYDRSTGKLTAHPDREEKKNPIALVTLETHGLVAVGEGGRVDSIRGYTLPKLEPAWEIPLPGHAELIATPVALGAAALFVTATRQDGATMSLTVRIVSAEGKVLQEIKGDRPYERPPTVQISKDGIVISVEQEVQYWKKR